MDPLAASEGIHALLLSGGSAFGLDAAGGVMSCLKEQNIGFDVGITKVPLVCQSSLFDLVIGDPDVRPDSRMAYQACEDADKRRSAITSGLFDLPEGNAGAGCGCTVGKYRGPAYAMKSGIGCYAVQAGPLKVGAIVAVNALGDIFDIENGQQIAGLLNQNRSALLSTEEAFLNDVSSMPDLFTGNTTIGAVLTNGAFSKAQANKLAAMAQNGLARTIRPVHTTAAETRFMQYPSETFPRTLTLPEPWLPTQWERPLTRRYGPPVFQPRISCRLRSYLVSSSFLLSVPIRKREPQI